MPNKPYFHPFCVSGRGKGRWLRRATRAATSVVWRLKNTNEREPLRENTNEREAGVPQALMDLVLERFRPKTVGQAEVERLVSAYKIHRDLDFVLE